MNKSKIARLILRVLGVLCVVYGAGIQFLGKGADMVPVWLILGVLCIVLSLQKPFTLVFSRKWVRILALACIVFVVVFEGVIIANGCRVEPREASDYIIVLGAKVDGEAPSKTLQYRLEAAFQYLTDFKSTKAILSGGQGWNEGISEAEAMYRYLVTRGIDSDRLVREDQSTSTYENLRNSFAILDDRENLRICVVSSDFHILRAKVIAYRLGRPVSGFGAKAYLPLIPNYYLREMPGIIQELLRP